jgi:outer membrane receptor for ferrienterochelin and colicins
MGSNVLTAGVEYLFDDIIDSIPQYQYGTNQQTNNIAAFLQSDWKILSSLTLLAGLRADRHNLVDHPDL